MLASSLQVTLLSDLVMVHGWCPCSLLSHIGKFTIPSSQLPGEVGVHNEEKSFWLWVLSSFKGAKRGQRGQKWAKGGQKVEKVLDGQLGSCVRGLPDRSDSRQMSTTVSRKEKIPLEIEVHCCCKSFIGLTFCLTSDGEILEIWISKNLQTTSKK